ncbi:LysR substrate-binding domain-containing protein [Streptomyces sp. M2CJ-2]|uniref:LysR substrate-binding domain-containing protein n=1 Tax=Streptomyces sp. M2CJ-2 TaxID=2803948 RepID=UPI0027DE5345|nr:LysR substrate-binding domain-containing protein [Streptomyces sp. M2CJ-2]
MVHLRADKPQAAGKKVSRDELPTEPLIAMRSGHAMHRSAHRLPEGRSPAFAHSTDGAETGKPMATEGLGTTALPEFGAAGDPLERPPRSDLYT